MRWLQVACMATVVLLIATTAMAGENEILSYRTFIDYAKQGKVKSVVITDFGTEDIKAKVEKDGAEVTYPVKKPYGAGQDALLLDFLTEKNIPHQILDKDRQSARSMWSAMLPGLVVLAVPGLLLLLVVILGIIMLSKISHVERMLESETRK